MSCITIWPNTIIDKCFGSYSGTFRLNDRSEPHVHTPNLFINKQPSCMLMYLKTKVTNVLLLLSSMGYINIQIRKNSILETDFQNFDLSISYCELASSF